MSDFKTNLEKNLSAEVYLFTSNIFELKNKTENLEKFNYFGRMHPTSSRTHTSLTMGRRKKQTNKKLGKIVRNVSKGAIPTKYKQKFFTSQKK